ncbi:MAG TPA: hypothetical protein VGJ95_23610 [Pseudonocardiaceae bacterium]|jgi:hypothetical protein
MAFVASLVVVVLGLMLTRTGDVPDDMRLFGWILVAIGILGLLAKIVLSRAKW